MIIEIKDRWDGSVKWSGEAIDMRDALRQAIRDGANLTGANLTRADLTGADLTDARSDIESVFALAPNEVAGLLTAIRSGRVDGSHYEGECACLVGTIANLRHEEYRSLSIDLRPNSARPAEILFFAIHKGDTPATNPISAIVAGWAEEWISAHGMAVPS